MPEAKWVIDRNVSPSEIVGPCGCRLPNTPEGHREAKGHLHPDDPGPDPRAGQTGDEPVEQAEQAADPVPDDPGPDPRAGEGETDG